MTSFHHPHLLQSWEWGELKTAFGWAARRLAWVGPEGEPRAASQLLFRTMRLPLVGLGFTLAYCPKGPALDWADAGARREALTGMIKAASHQGAFMLKIDPEVPLSLGPEQGSAAVPTAGSGEAGEPGLGSRALGDSPEAGPPGAAVVAELLASGWRRSNDRVQFDNTLLIDLTGSEDQILARMKQKTRYNIRLAQRHGVQVRPGRPDDLDLLFRMYAETSSRDGFVIRDPAYYRRAWASFMEQGLAQPFIAEVEGEPVSGLIAYRFGDTAWYLYGMSRSEHREKMPNHLLQWEAMCWARAGGCRVYDLVGIPGRPDPSDPLWGLYRFKVGFGGELLQTIGAWDYPLRPAVYWLYRQVMPRALAVMRLRGRRRTQALIE